jgi:protein SON
MGWRPGEGLGKDKTGQLQPLLLEVKLDKKGLVSNEETAKPKRNQAPPRMTLEGKHPVSLLGELASKRRWGSPQYDVILESGPQHCKLFIFKVSLFRSKEKFATNLLSVVQKKIF